MSTTTIEQPCTHTDHDTTVHTGTRQTCSGLLREGARYHPQGKGTLYNHTFGTTCALGALIAGLLGPECFEQTQPPGGLWGLDIDRLVRQRTGVSLQQHVWLPDHPPVPSTVQGAMIYLNDQLGWTYEAIAQWLETQGL